MCLGLALNLSCRLHVESSHHSQLNPWTPVVDFTLSNIGRFYSSRRGGGNSGVTGLKTLQLPFFHLLSAVRHNGTTNWRRQRAEKKKENGRCAKGNPKELMVK